MKKILLVMIMLFPAAFSTKAQNKNAFVVGIDNYSPSPGSGGIVKNQNLLDLEGCKNDALAIISLIRSKFDFPETNIDTLFDTDATRERILAGLKKLLAKSKKGDVAFFYYAGHGSQVTNSLSKEKDKKDETIVPNDFWNGKAATQIRDKELAKLFNEFLDKGINLTVILDCCHSGSLSRGPILATGRSRYAREMENSDYDAKDDSEPTPPESRKDGKFLILSASQSDEVAKECKDENNTKHGAFTVALLKALNQQSVDASVQNLFVSLRAIIKGMGYKQEPVLGALPERQAETLLGLSKGALVDRIQVPVIKIDNITVELQGGYALQLYKNTELLHITGKDTIKLKIDSVLSINKSRAKVIRGDLSALAIGQLFEVSNWISSQAPLLKVYIPKNNFSYSKVAALAEISKAIKANKTAAPAKNVKWINDLETVDPHSSVFYVNDKCYMNIEGKGISEVKNPTLPAILGLCKKDSTFYFELPPMNELSLSLKEEFEKNKNFELVETPEEANYVVYGTLSENNKIAYGLRRAITSARDSLESMPVQTKSFILNDNSKDSYAFVTDSLYEYAKKISKVKGWIDLSAPVNRINSFPYHLEFTNVNTNETIKNLTYKVNDLIKLILKADEVEEESALTPRFIYVFGIDKNGSISLIYPGENDNQNIQNKFSSGKTEFELARYKVIDPAGTDKIFLLSTKEPIPNYGVIFNQTGTRSINTESTNSLSNLLDLGNERGSKESKKINDRPDWSLLKVYIKSTH